MGTFVRDPEGTWHLLWRGWRTAPPFVRPLPPLRPCAYKCGPALCPGRLSRLCKRDYPRKASE